MSSILKVDTLQDTGANTILASDGSGNLTTQKTNYPAFFLIKSSTQAISANTNTKVTWDGTLFDTDSGFDNTNDRWTVPTGKAGKYYLSLALGHTNSINQNSDLTIEMRRYNSSDTIQQYQLKNARQGGSNNHYGTYNMDTIWDCSAGDYFQIFFKNVQDACTLDGNALEGALSYSNAEHTSFIGFRIGD